MGQSSTITFAFESHFQLVNKVKKKMSHFQICGAAISNIFLSA
jgi:hypothetical protein